MTTGELIRLLQQVDPTGDVPVCVDNHDIWIVTKDPAYHDGALERIDGDRARIVSTGEKVRIYPRPIEEWLLDHPDGDVDIIGTDYHGQHASRVMVWREQARSLLDRG